jgi:hypothetical protein
MNQAYLFIYLPYVNAMVKEINEFFNTYATELHSFTKYSSNQLNYLINILDVLQFAPFNIVAF